MPFKRTTFPAKMKIGIHFEELTKCTEIGTFLLLQGSQIRKTNVFDNADLYRRISKNAILMHFHAIIPDKCELENILTAYFK